MKIPSGIKSRSIHSLLREIDQSKEEFDPVKDKARYDKWRKKKLRTPFVPIPPKWDKEQARKRFYGNRPKNPINRRTILVVDEAGMVDTRKMQRLVQEIKKAGASIRLIGGQEAASGD